MIRSHRLISPLLLAGAVWLAPGPVASAADYQFDFTVPVAVTKIPATHQRAWLRCCVARDTSYALSATSTTGPPGPTCAEVILPTTGGAIEESVAVRVRFTAPVGSTGNDYSHYACRFDSGPSLYQAQVVNVYTGNAHVTGSALGGR